MRPLYAIDAWALTAVYYFAEGYAWWWGAVALAVVAIMLLLADAPTRRKP